MNVIESVVSYIDMPSALKAGRDLASVNPTIYVKYVDGEGFDLSLAELDDATGELLENPLALQYIAFKPEDEGALLEFDFRRGTARFAYELPLEDAVELVVRRLKDDKGHALKWFLESGRSTQLKDILRLETGRFLIRCIDAEGVIWRDTDRSKQVQSAVQASIVLFSLTGALVEEHFVNRVIERSCTYYCIVENELRAEKADELIRRALDEFSRDDETIRLISAVLASGDEVSGLLLKRNSAGYWTHYGRPHSSVTAIAHEALKPRLET